MRRWDGTRLNAYAFRNKVKNVGLTLTRIQRTLAYKTVKVYSDLVANRLTYSRSPELEAVLIIRMRKEVACVTRWKVKLMYSKRILNALYSCLARAA